MGSAAGHARCCEGRLAPDTDLRQAKRNIPVVSLSIKSIMLMVL
jgi:hypothetical protein